MHRRTVSTFQTTQPIARGSNYLYRDMVDTENADGDFYKMFLGSILEDIDNKIIQGGSADPLSVYAPTSASAVTGESSTLASRRASASSHLLNQLQSRTSYGYRNDPSAYP